MIIAHEFTHGVSNRLTGGPSNANALNAMQSGGLGEGWSDFASLWFTQKPTDSRTTPIPWARMCSASHRRPGIRRYPYSYDMTIDPLTLGHYNGGSPTTKSTTRARSGRRCCGT